MNAWNEIGEAALEIADVLMTTEQQLQRCAEQLQSLISRAADTKHEDEETKRAALKVWYATMIRAQCARDNLTGPTPEFLK